MRGLFNASFAIAGLTTAKTLGYLTTPSSKSIEIVRIEIENGSNETNEQIAVSLKKVSSLGTPTGTTLTPAKTTDGDQSAGTAGKYDVTANEPTYSDVLIRYGFGTLYGLEKDLSMTPIEVPPSTTVGITLDANCSAFDCRVNVWFKEHG